MNLVKLSRKAVETFVLEGKMIEALKQTDRAFLKQRAGVFVTIEKNNQLRGCLGTYLPTEKNIAEEVIHNAVGAATEDWRFGPITKEELPHLKYKVYILGQPETVQDLADLNPKKYGILIKNDSGKSGLLLPGIEEIKSPERQLAVVCQKAGISPSQEKFVLYRFTVQKYEE